MMKKLFFSILALAAFVACQDNFEEVSFDAPQVGGGGDDVEVNENRLVTIFAEVAVGEDSRATYGEDLSAKWEDGDQIALLQESANYGYTFSTVNKLNILEGSGTGRATFNGDITVSTDLPRIYHIAYPASAVSFSTSSSLTAVNVSYEDSNDVLGFDNVTATGVGQYTYNSTLNITLPTSQSGKWEPYMYASTSKAVAANAIGADTLTTLTGAIAIRAFENDGTTPKQLRSITVTATKPIAGLFKGTATSVGTTTSVSGAETGDKHHWSYTAEEIRAMALNNLLAKLQGMQPATTTTSEAKAMSFSFAGSENTITADVSKIAADLDGNYTYHLNVAPFENADLTLTATAIDGSKLVRTVSAQSIAASHRKGYIFTWEAASLTAGSAETWYDDDYNKSEFTLQGSTIYARNLEIEGVTADKVLKLGVIVNDTLHEETAKTGVLSVDEIVISGLTSGVYQVSAYAKVEVNGEEKELYYEIGQKTVTAIPQFTECYVKSSYSNNGVVSKTNDIYGDKLLAKADLNDSYIENNLVASKKFHYGSNSVDLTFGIEKELTIAQSAWGQYSCYVKVTLKNGYVCQSSAHKTHITGIPYSIAMQDHSSDASSLWTSYKCSYKDDYIDLLPSAKNNGRIVSPKFGCPENCVVAYTVDAKYYRGAGTPLGYPNATVYVGATANTSTAAVMPNSHTIDSTQDTAHRGFTTVGSTVTMSASNPYISISHNNPRRYDAGIQGYLGVRNITINYSL